MISIQSCDSSSFKFNLFVKDEQFVQAVFTDMKVDKRLKEEFEKSLEQVEGPND